MDGLEYTPDGRVPWGWGTTSLDNVTNAYHDGFLGECISAGPSRCALASNSSLSSPDTDPNLTQATSLNSLIFRMDSLFERLKARPIPGFTKVSGPGIVTYENTISLLYEALYNPSSWPKFARLLVELEAGNATLALEAFDKTWGYDPEKNETDKGSAAKSEELTTMVICVSSGIHS